MSASNIEASIKNLEITHASANDTQQDTAKEETQQGGSEQVHDTDDERVRYYACVIMKGVRMASLLKRVNEAIDAFSRANDTKFTSEQKRWEQGRRHRCTYDFLCAYLASLDEHADLSRSWAESKPEGDKEDHSEAQDDDDAKVASED